MLKRSLKSTNTLESKALLDRINRIQGQVGGIIKMIEEERSCISVVQQIMAARSALSQVATKLLAQESCKCDYRANPAEMEAMLKQLVDMN